MIEPYCKTQYQRMMTLEEKLQHKGENAFCLIGDIRCPYYSSRKSFDYCKYTVLESEKQWNKNSSLRN